MKIRESLAIVASTPLCLIGLGTAIIFGIASYNQKSIEFVPIIIGIIAFIIGWMLARYAAKRTGLSTLEIILELWP